MLKRFTTAYLVTTALTIAPAFAQGGGATASASQPAANQAQAFVTQAAQGGMFEIQSSQLALKKSQDRDVRQFAQRMITDHTKADDQLKSIAKNETVPGNLDQQHETMLSQLQGKDGSDFVDQFKQMQVSAHQQAVDLFENYSHNGDDRQLKRFAEQTLPTLKQHLQMAEQITVASTADHGQQTAATAQSGGNQSFITQETPGTWRASKVIGLGVYNEQSQKVGDISDVLFDRSGKLEGVVIGVGGFLGIGERNVAVPYSDLKWAMSAPNSRNAANGRAGADPSGGTMTPPGLGSPASPINPAPNMPASENTNMANASSSSNQPAAYPDHAILPNASKDQLNSAPQFQYGAAPK